MNIEKLKTAWYPMLLSKNLSDKPKAVTLLDQKLVLVRLNGTALCFDDCCPHRHYPLSLGKVADDKLICAYHGWQFDAAGAVCRVSGEMCQGVKSRLKQFACHEYDDWIWVNLTDGVAFTDYADFRTPAGFERIHATRRMTGDFIHAIENLLDPTHTTHIHHGILRNLNHGVQSMKVSQSHDEHSFSTRYELIEQQNGLMNRLFDKGITVNVASFSFPSVASIDYYTPTSLEYRISVFFIPHTKGDLSLQVHIHLPRNKLPLRLKSLLLRPFLTLIFYQDKRAVAKQYQHQRFPKQAFISTANDLVIDHLLYLLADAPEGVDKSGIMTLE